jgi:hypothetical protein
VTRCGDGEFRYETESRWDVSYRPGSKQNSLYLPIRSEKVLHIDSERQREIKVLRDSVRPLYFGLICRPVVNAQADLHTQRQIAAM